jgi:nucleoside-diphosphate-sugar epimerase
MAKKKHTILITGATGFVGSVLARAFFGDGHDVHILAREQSPDWRIGDLASLIRMHRCDLLDAPLLANVVGEIQPDFIFHCANAGVYGGASVSDHALMETNVVGLMNLLAALRPVPYSGFVNFGSSSEYGPKERPMKETDICEPANFYGVSKLAATGIAYLEGQLHDKPIMTLRLFSPYGPYDDHRRLIRRTIADLLDMKPLGLRNPDARRDYIFIDDVAALCKETLNRVGECRGDVFNVGTGVERRIKDVVNTLIALTGDASSVEWTTAPPRKDESPRWEADMTKTFSFFSWRPCYTLEQGLEKTYEWMRAHRTGSSPSS